MPESVSYIRMLSLLNSVAPFTYMQHVTRNIGMGPRRTKTHPHHATQCRAFSSPMFAFAARQHEAGDDAWLQHCMRQPEKKLKEDLNKALGMSCAGARLARERMTHMDILKAALSSDCICEGMSIPGWVKILEHNGLGRSEPSQKRGLGQNHVVQLLQQLDKQFKNSTHIESRCYTMLAIEWFVFLIH